MSCWRTPWLDRTISQLCVPRLLRGARNHSVVSAHLDISREYGSARFDAQPDFAGVTDSEGAWTLERSPCRVILNWTSNGALQFVVQPKDGVKRVGFLNITDFNLPGARRHPSRRA